MEKKSEINMDVEIGNKLIAEFMGGKYRKGNKKQFTEERYFDLKNKGYYYLVSELQYHTSWDWLMHVVEKIESLGYDFEFKKQGKFTNVRFKGIIDYNCKRYDNITAIYNAVVEFIKWYNENKNK